MDHAGSPRAVSVDLDHWLSVTTPPAKAPVSSSWRGPLRVYDEVMSDWVSQHKASIQYVVATVVGAGFAIYGVLTDDPALVALGAGALGLPGFQAAAPA